VTSVSSVAIESLMWLVTVAAVIGTIANVRRRRWCFAVWIFTNAAWAWYDIYKIAYPQAALQAIYLCLSVWGLCSWRNQSSVPSVSSVAKEVDANG